MAKSQSAPEGEGKRAQPSKRSHAKTGRYAKYQGPRGEGEGRGGKRPPAKMGRRGKSVPKQAKWNMHQGGGWGEGEYLNVEAEAEVEEAEAGKAGQADGAEDKKKEDKEAKKEDKKVKTRSNKGKKKSECSLYCFFRRVKA